MLRKLTKNIPVIENFWAAGEKIRISNTTKSRSDETMITSSVPICDQMEKYLIPSSTYVKIIKKNFLPGHFKGPGIRAAYFERASLQDKVESKKHTCK